MRTTTDDDKSANPKEKTGSKPNSNPSKGHGTYVYTAAMEFSDNAGKEPEVCHPITAAGVPSKTGE